MAVTTDIARKLAADPEFRLKIELALIRAALPHLRAVVADVNTIEGKVQALSREIVEDPEPFMDRIVRLVLAHSGFTVDITDAALLGGIDSLLPDLALLLGQERTP